jgi:hypothetical protein
LSKALATGEHWLLRSELQARRRCKLAEWQLAAQPLTVVTLLV